MHIMCIVINAHVGICLHNNSVYIPIADNGDCSEGVTVTVIGVLDDPPVTITITSINPDDSEPVNCPDANSTTNTSIAAISYNTIK